MSSDEDVAELARRAAAYDLEAARALVRAIERVGAARSPREGPGYPAVDASGFLKFTERALDEISRQVHACMPQRLTHRLDHYAGGWQLDVCQEPRAGDWVFIVPADRVELVILVERNVRLMFDRLHIDWVHRRWAEVPWDR